MGESSTEFILGLKHPCSEQVSRQIEGTLEAISAEYLQCHLALTDADGSLEVAFAVLSSFTIPGDGFAGVKLSELGREQVAVAILLAVLNPDLFNLYQVDTDGDATTVVPDPNHVGTYFSLATGVDESPVRLEHTALTLFQKQRQAMLSLGNTQEAFGFF